VHDEHQLHTRTVGLSAPREQLDEVIALQRLGAVSDVAEGVALGLEQLRADLQPCAPC